MRSLTLENVSFCSHALVYCMLDLESENVLSCRYAFSVEGVVDKLRGLVCGLFGGLFCLKLASAWQSNNPIVQLPDLALEPQSPTE